MTTINLERLSSQIQALADDKLRNTFEDNIPDYTDQIIMEIVEGFFLATNEQKLLLAGLFSLKQSGRLIRFAHRMSIYAVRKNDPKYIYYGLVAVALENFRDDFRDTIWVIPLLKHSSIKLGVDYESLFLKAAAYAGPQVAQFLGDCALEGPEKRSIDQWDYKEAKTKDGLFTYIRSDILNLPG